MRSKKYLERHLRHASGLNFQVAALRQKARTRVTKDLLIALWVVLQARSNLMIVS
jgi:hypothetical protein